MGLPCSPSLFWALKSHERQPIRSITNWRVIYIYACTYPLFFRLQADLYKGQLGSWWGYGALINLLYQRRHGDGASGPTEQR